MSAETEISRTRLRRFRTVAAFAAALALWGALSPQRGLALPGDRDQPIYIQSDRAERDERKGTVKISKECLDNPLAKGCT